MPRKLILAIVALGMGVASAALGGIAGPNPLTPPPALPPQGVLGYRAPTAETSQPVFAILGRRVLLGRSQPDTFGSGGAVVLRDQDEPDFSCVGGYGYVARVGGRAQFKCSDGSRFQVAYHGISDDTAVGRGSSAGSTVSLCFGFPAKAAARHLVAPPGYVLVERWGQLTLKPAGA
jgi:hypothetical protein